MKNSVENISETRVKLTVEVPAEEFAPDYEKAVKVVAKQVNVPGFRPGKAPRRVLEGKIGKGYIIEQAINDNLDKYYQAAASDAGIVPMSRPEVSIEEVPEMAGKGDKTQLLFVVEVDVRPEITLPNPADVKIEVPSTEVTDEDVEKELDSLRERFATLTDVKRKAKEGDYVNIDMIATIGDEEIDDVSGVSYRIGEGNMLEGQDEALTGAKADDVVEFKAKLAGGDHEGEEADVKVTVHSVKESVLPEADDEFAQIASEFDTIEELKEDLRATVEKNKADGQLAGAQEQLADELLKLADFPLPQGVIDEEIANHLRNEGKAADDAHGEEIRPDIEEALKQQLLMDTYAEAFKVEVSQQELLDFLINQAQMYGMDPNQFIQAAAETNQLGAFAGELARNKSMFAALRLAEVVDDKGNKVDVNAILGDAPENETVPDFSAKPKKKPAKNAGKKDEKADSDEKKSEKKPAKKADSDEKKPAKKAAAKKDAKAEEKAADESADFDPSDHVIDEVVAYFEKADDAEKKRVIKAEKAGKARKTLLAQLEG